MHYSNLIANATFDVGTLHILEVRAKYAVLCFMCYLVDEAQQGSSESSEGWSIYCATNF